MSDDGNLNTVDQRTGGQSYVARNGLPSSGAAPLWSRVFGWIWFLNCLLMALLGTAHSAVFAGLFYLTSGAMALPPLWRRLRHAGITWSGKRRVAVGFGAIIIAFFASVPSRPTHKADAEQPIATAQPDVRPSKPTAVSEAERVRVQADAAKALERKNKAKIAENLAAVKALDARDYEGQLLFWKETAALAPANAEYARKRRELEQKVEELSHVNDSPSLGAQVEKVAGHKEAFGNVLVIDITIRNDNQSHLKDFNITCDSIGPSGTVISSNSRILYDTVEARKTRTFRNLNMGFINRQSTKLNCRIDEASIA